MPYVWDTFETYRLRQADLEDLLREKFGPYEFYISVRRQTKSLQNDMITKPTGQQWPLSILGSKMLERSMSSKDH
jgi:hypothetical protein